MSRSDNPGKHALVELPEHRTDKGVKLWLRPQWLAAKVARGSFFPDTVQVMRVVATGDLATTAVGDIIAAKGSRFAPLADLFLIHESELIARGEFGEVIPATDA